MKTLKTSFASAFVFFVALGSVFAQNISQVVIASSPDGEKGSTVISKVEKDLQEVKPIEKGLGFMKTYPTRWKIAQEQIDTYGKGYDNTFTEITTKSGDETQTAVYNSNGEMVQFKGMVVNKPLPQAAMDVIINQYNDWKILGNVQVFNSESRNPDFIKVKLAEGMKRKTLFFDLDGKKLNRFLKPVNS